jgi:hypothetical protein
VNPDHEIFDTVITDLIGELRRPGNRRRQIICSDTTLGKVDPVLLRHDVSGTAPITPSAAVEDLIARNSKEFSLAAYRPGNPEIVVKHLGGRSFYDMFPHAFGYIKPRLPGYSPDGKTAVFDFYLGPSEHGTAGSYFLTNRAGRWEVFGTNIRHYD